MPRRPGNSYRLPPSGNSIQSSSGIGYASQPLRPVAYKVKSSKILPLPSEYNKKGVMGMDNDTNDNENRIDFKPYFLAFCLEVSINVLQKSLKTTTSLSRSIS